MAILQEPIARRIAEHAHEGQVDKAGKPYIEHPKYVASQMSGDTLKATAWLHDVVEDSSYSYEDLKAEGISDDVIEALKLLTHDPSVPYMDYIRKIKTNPIAQEVKLADLRHNSDIGRLQNPTKSDYKRIEKYRQAIEILNA